jgi:hypothetical protein
MAVDGVGEDGVPVFTRDDIKRLPQIIARTSTMVKPTE